MMRRRLLVLTLLGLAGLPWMGCGMWSGQGGVPSDSLTLQVDVANSTPYLAGQAMEVRVVLTNHTKKTQSLPRLDARSLRFYLGRAESAERVERSPVISSTEALGRPMELGPQGSVERRFVLTRGTEIVGPLEMQVHYDPNYMSGVTELTKAYSNVVKYDVESRILFARDSEGLIMENEAIKLASAATSATVTGSAARLVQDAREGLYLWQVNLSLADAGQGARTVAYLVDPYRGRVLVPVRPFDPLAEIDPSVVRRPGDGARPAGATPDQGQAQGSGGTVSSGVNLETAPARVDGLTSATRPAIDRR